MAVKESQSTFESIAGYVPGSLVTGHNAIDLDQQEIENHLIIGTNRSFGLAQNVYEQGAHSRSFARVSIFPALASTLARGTKIFGYTADGKHVFGKALLDVGEGRTEISIHYVTSPMQEHYLDCIVGGSAHPVLEGCLAVTGNLTFDGMNYQYSYIPEEQNFNDRTIQGFSLQAREEMSGYTDYDKFYNYYGKHDYADKWVLAAFDGTATSFDNGNANFGHYSKEGRTEAIRKGTVYLAIYMYVLGELESALDDCNDSCIRCNYDDEHAWDEAVAFYTGSLEGQDGSGEGLLMYALADMQCQKFRTCGVDGDKVEGTSKMNIDTFGQFALGQQNLIQGNCEGARRQKERISELMKIPILQGALRSAYVKELETSEKAEADGAVFAAAILPHVHYCSPKDAKRIYKNMGVGSNRTKFKAVKAAFEKNYECMGVTCADVGGIINPATGEYYDGAAPCNDEISFLSFGDDNTVGIVFGVAASVVALVAICGMCFMWRREKLGKPVFNPTVVQERAALNLREIA